MRIDKVNYSVDRLRDGTIGRASIYFENMNNIGERITGNFALTIEEFEKVEKGLITPESLVIQKITDILTLTTDEDSTAKINKLQQEIADNQEMITELSLLISQNQGGSNE